MPMNAHCLLCHATLDSPVHVTSEGMSNTQYAASEVVQYCLLPSGGRRTLYLFRGGYMPAPGGVKRGESCMGTFTSLPLERFTRERSSWELLGMKVRTGGRCWPELASSRPEELCRLRCDRLWLPLSESDMLPALGSRAHISLDWVVR